MSLTDTLKRLEAFADHAYLHCFVFFLIACRGGVRWCLDEPGR